MRGELLDLAPRLPRFLAQAVFNLLITQLPGHWLRLAWLRALGARVGRGTIVFRGTTVLGARHLVLGERVQVGFRVVLDARGGLTVADDVLLSSDSQLLTANHNLASDDFERRVAPIAIGDHAWVATRAIVLAGVTIGRGGVVAAGGVATRHVPPLTIVGGVPARQLGERTGGLEYRLDARRPPLY
jgi:putative colanic acid biosynthesis acetyltransferase WcaF